MIIAQCYDPAITGEQCEKITNYECHLSAEALAQDDITNL